MDKIMVGRCEWCSLPDLAIPRIKAKMDTGARTSALHAFNIHTETVENKRYALFSIHPLQRNALLTHHCRALILEQRAIMSSNGHKENRYIVQTTLQLGEHCYTIELSLSNRDPLRFRLLLGREALNKRMVVDPSLVHQQRKKKTL